ncbi:hypothetical protein [Streptomyces bambusae]|uniref:Uncharacterized protein n=1 Tax=Streptomyces bambusae TaxID=1550616 RepID=A0ABS6Z758_9ACTN|nr:hypothetical protein [Streptomyces bambusae]MBW5483406.1 hypothetical protein [Streptomyces bambusae]
MARKTPLVAVVHDGRQGRASPQAFAARDGAAEAGARSVLVGVESLGEPQWALLRAAGGVLLGARLPDAAEHGDWLGKPAAGFTDPYADPYARLRELCSFAERLGMHWIGMDVPPWWQTDHATEASLDSVRLLGARVARLTRALLAENDPSGVVAAAGACPGLADEPPCLAPAVAARAVPALWRRG